MQLHEQGLLSIDDPVSKYIPFPSSLAKDPICIKHILSHTTGIPDLGGSMNAKARTLGRFGEMIPMGDTKDFFLHITEAEHEIDLPPGQVFFYTTIFINVWLISLKK